MTNHIEYFLRSRVRYHYDQYRFSQARSSRKNVEEHWMHHDEEWQAVQDYNTRMQTILPGDTSDPFTHRADAHDMSLHELREELTQAVGERKAQALPLAIQIFNRIQEKVAGTTTRLEVKTDPESELLVDSINETVEKAEVLLKDQSSPLLGNIRALKKYATQKLPETIDEYRETVDRGDIIDQPVDLNTMINDYIKLNRTEETLRTMEQEFDKVEGLLEQRKAMAVQEAN